MKIDYFEHIDTVFASSVLKENTGDESCFLALSYLFASTRQGHHCVSVVENSLSPSPEKIFENGEFPEELLDKVILGFNRLPKEIIQENVEKITLKPIVKSQGNYYLQKYFFLEEKIAEDIERLSKAFLKIVFSREEIEKEISFYKNVLNKEQEEAILNSLCQPVHLLTGGPGTGKTYTIRYLLQIYKQLCKKHHYDPRIILAAPTGKATSALKKNFSQAEGDFIEVHTLHSALKIKKKEDVHKKHYLFNDLIIVDECSMIDLHLWKALLSSIEEGSRVIFMGDHHQLPPVETGMVFEQFVKVIPCSYLKKCMRTERKELLNLAEAIQENKEDVLENYFNRKEAEACYFEYEKEVELFSLDKQFLKPFLEHPSYKNVIILTTILKGNWGVETINEQLYAFFLQKVDRSNILEIPIMITKTDYTQQLYNGDRGVLIKHKDAESKDYAVFESREGKIPVAFLPSYQYAYALSVHKSQGSEYDEVLLLLPEGSQNFGKEVVYTGITRAKKKITVISKTGIFKKCLEVEAKKNSALSERILLKRKI